MTILVTGAAGFLGTALTRTLLAQTHACVRCLVRTTSSRARLEPLAQASSGRVQLHEGTLDTVRDAESAVEGAEVVYHLAAGMNGTAEEVHRNTVTASEHLLTALERQRHRVATLVLASSFAVYGAATLPEGALLDEDAALEPHPERRDPYARAKLAQERLFRGERARVGYRLVVVRPGVIYGPSGPVPLHRLGLRLGRLFVAVNRRSVLPATFVENCADAMAFLGGRPELDDDTFNIVDDDLPTRGAFLSAYMSREARLRVVPAPFRAMLLLARAAEFARRRRLRVAPIPDAYRVATMWASHRYTNARLAALGWRPRVQTAQALRQTFPDQRLPGP